MHEELLFFCRAFWAGACLAAGYDLLRIFRRLVSHSPFLTGAEDILYWCCAGIYLFGMIYRENDGVIRTYALLAVFCFDRAPFHFGRVGRRRIGCNGIVSLL